jgi:hypothetical protein
MGGTICFVPVVDCSLPKPRSFVIVRRDDQSLANAAGLYPSSENAGCMKNTFITARCDP